MESNTINQGIIDVTRCLIPWHMSSFTADFHEVKGWSCKDDIRGSWWHESAEALRLGTAVWRYNHKQEIERSPCTKEKSFRRGFPCHLVHRRSIFREYICPDSNRMMYVLPEHLSSQGYIDIWDPYLLKQAWVTRDPWVHQSGPWSFLVLLVILSCCWA